MKTASKRPSAKIFALIISAILIVGSAVYLKYFSPTAIENSALGYTESGTAGKIDIVAQALVNELLKPPTPDSAFANPNFEAADNLSDRFSKSAFAAYMSLQNVGADDTTSQESVIQTMLQGTQAIENPDKYSLSNISTFSSKNKVDLLKYANDFATIEQTNFLEVKNNQKKYKSDPSAFADVYLKIAKELAALAAPTDVASLHLKAVNVYENIGESYKAILEYDKDPLKALLAIKKAKELTDAQPKEYEQWKKFWTDNGILFTKDDPAWQDWGQGASTEN